MGENTINSLKNDKIADVTESVKMSIIDFKHAAEQKEWRTNKAWQNVRETVNDFSYTLNLTGEEVIAVKLAIEMIMETNLAEREDKSFVGKMFLDSLQSVLDKIDNDIEIE